jgi:fatty acid synthase subunit beta
MVAVDPGRVSKKFDELALREMVSAVNKAGFFVEIVNLNVRESQYVCAGDLRALDMLQVVLDEINTGKSSVNTPCIDLISAHVESYESRLPSDVTLKRGKATVPLNGVDVPFHSSFLRTRMEAFRRVLLANLEKGRIQPEKLVGKYIPNVTGRPFGISKADCEEVWDITKSERLRGVLDTWEESGLAPTVNAAA